MNDDDVEFINEFGKGFEVVARAFIFAAVILSIAVLIF